MTDLWQTYDTLDDLLINLRALLHEAYAIAECMEDNKATLALTRRARELTEELYRRKKEEESPHTTVRKR